MKNVVGENLHFLLAIQEGHHGGHHNREQKLSHSWFYSQGLNWLSRAEPSNKVSKGYESQYLLSRCWLDFKEEMSNVAGSAFLCWTCNPRSIPTCCFHHYWANNCPRLRYLFSKETQEQTHLNPGNAQTPRTRERAGNVVIKILKNNMLKKIDFSGLQKEFANIYLK